MQDSLFERLVGPVAEVRRVYDKPIRAQRLYSSNLMMSSIDGAEICIESFQSLHRALRKHLAGAVPGAKIYLSRHDAGGEGRQFGNLEQFEALLRDHGFIALMPTRHTLAETIALLGDAACVIGIHGAGCANMLFAPASCRIIELWDYPGSWPSLALMAAAVGFDHHVVAAVPPGDDELPAIDLARIAALIA